MYHEKLSDDIGHCKNLGYKYVFSIFIQRICPLLVNFPSKFLLQKRDFIPKIFGIFGLKSSKLRRFFDNLKWTEDEDEDGSSAKNLRRTKIFEASLQHCLLEAFFWRKLIRGWGWLALENLVIWSSTIKKSRINCNKIYKYCHTKITIFEVFSVHLLCLCFEFEKQTWWSS